MNFSEVNAARLEELQKLLNTDVSTAADVEALGKTVDELWELAVKIEACFDDDQLQQYAGVIDAAKSARILANSDAAALFGDEPLPGVGSDSWRILWQAARDYSISEAFKATEFPIVSKLDDEKACLLCHQPLSPEASDRLLRFQNYIASSLAEAARLAEDKRDATKQSLSDISMFKSERWGTLLDQIKKRDFKLSQTLENFVIASSKRSAHVDQLFKNQPKLDDELPALEPISETLSSFSAALKLTAGALKGLEEGVERQKLLSELADLEDLKLLAAQIENVRDRRNNLVSKGLYEKAISDLQTANITKKASELIDTHLTTAVIKDFSSECTILDMGHVKVKLARKSDQKKALFQTHSGSAAAKDSSAILSEGEQRGLALAAFFTELKHNEGMGPIVIDDPVSSLDRDRSQMVAIRIAQEAKSRQVIVFTHDLVFFNELSKAAELQSVPTKGVHLFANDSAAGNVDPSGIVWKGARTKSRIAQIRDELSRVKKLEGTSPSQYQLAIKRLYGSLRDTYERLVEEHIFSDIIIRGVDRVETQKLRFVHLSDDIANMFHEGMTRANTHSHDNPMSESVKAPGHTDLEGDLQHIEAIISSLKTEAEAAELRRPAMKPKKP